MLRAVPLLILCLAVPATAAAAPAKPLGTLRLAAWDARKDVYFESVQVWREGCDLRYKLTYRRAQRHPVKLRLLLELDAGPSSSATSWIASSTDGDQSAEGTMATPGCWIKKATRIKRVSTEVVGAPPPPASPDGRDFLGKVDFNRWGSSADVYYRHIQIWRKGCAIYYQFLYKRHSPQRRRLKLRLVTDAGTAESGWYRSSVRGWREIAGSVETPGCWAARAKTLKNAGFESERY